MSISLQTAHDALSKVRDPAEDKPLTDTGMVRDLNVEGTTVSLGIDLTPAAAANKDGLEAEIRVALTDAGASDVAIEWGSKSASREVGPDDPCPGVKNIILVVSGKGGVGIVFIFRHIGMILP